MASFLARRTMFSIMAPDEKSLKYMISLSPFWYVTSRNWLASSVRYISATVRLDHRLHGLRGVATAERADLVLVERQVGR